MLTKAINIAIEAHEGAFDKRGVPYIDHALRVMAMGVTDDEKIVGVLHDVVDDSEWTFEKLTQEGFSDTIIEAIRCLSKCSEDELCSHYIQRVKQNELAAKVKSNDLIDNMDIRRLDSLSKGNVARLREYLKAYKKLHSEAKREPKYSLENLRAEYANAYKPWSSKEDEELELLWCEGVPQKELSEIFQRHPGAISSRIKKLELKEKYPQD